MDKSMGKGMGKGGKGISNSTDAKQRPKSTARSLGRHTFSMLDIPSKNRASKTAFLGQTEVLNNMMQKRKRETRS